MSKLSEHIRRSTHRLAARERDFATTKDYLRTLTPVRRMDLAAWLLAITAADEANNAEATVITDLALKAKDSHQRLLQRAVAESRIGTLSPRATETPAAAPVPPTVPSAAISGQSGKRKAESEN